MDGLSGAASIIAVIDISTKVASLCFQYSTAVKDAKKDIERLRNAVEDIKAVLERIQQLLETQGKARLSTTHELLDSLKQCLQDLQKLDADLEPRKSRKAMSRFGIRALRWPFTSKQVQKSVSGLEQYKQTFNLALLVDQTHVVLDLDYKLDLAKLPTAKGASFDSHMEEHNSTCLPKTRTELLRRIQDWVEDKNGKSIFWLNGAAGTGKSTIARTVAQTFAKQKLGASFFFKRGEGERGNATRFFTTVSTQLAVRVPEIKPGIKKAVDADPAISEKALKDQFEKLILRPLLEVKHLPPLVLVIVIDALDECEGDSDVRAILQLLSQKRDFKSVSLRLFVTSRPELHIRIGFKQMSDGTYEDLILHEVARQTIQQDIRVYFEYELGQIRTERSLSQDWPSRDQIDALVEQAVPLFIFAATACRYIGDRRNNPRKRLDILLKHRKTQVSKYDATYLPILTQLFDEEDEGEKERWACEFREIVGSIVILESPLATTSLAHLLHIPEEDIRCRLDSLHSVLSIPDNNDLPIRLLHLSFREFLVDASKQNSPFWVNEKERHEMLTSQCIELMAGPNGLRKNICNILTPGILRSEIDEGTIASNLPPELQYACRYWVYHLQQSGRNLSSGDSADIFLFLRKHLLHWLEALSLIGETNRCTRLIKALHVLANSTNSTLSLFLQDAERFSLQFQYIFDKAPLQIYSSALLFAPVASIIRKTFVSEMSDSMKILPKSEVSWDVSRSVLEGHTGVINAVAFSPDGKLVASASDDSTVRMWEVVTGSCRSVLEGHTNWVGNVTFSPDGKLLASASGDTTVRMWEAATGSCCGVLEGHSDLVSSVAFSSDGKLIASASDDLTVRVWEAETGSCHNVLKGHGKWVKDITFSPDGRLVASSSADNTVRMWDATTGECINVLEGHTDWVMAIAFSPNGKLVASASQDSMVRMWEAATGSCSSVLEGHTDWVNDVAFSPDGKLIVSASNDNTVRVWETATMSCSSVLEGHTDGVKAISFSPNGDLVASACDDNTMRVWEVVTWSCSSVLEGHTDWINDIVFSPDGKLVASASNDNMVRLWEAETSPHVLDNHTNMYEGHTKEVSAMAFSPDGKLLVSASKDKTVRVWEAATGSCSSVLEGHTNWVMAIAFSPDGKLVASASYDNTVRVWETATGLCISVLEGHTDRARAIAFSPDGKLVASASHDNTVRMWEAVTGSCINVFEGHTDWIMAITFSPNGKLVASASQDSTVRVWEAATGSCRSVFEGHTNWVRSVAFSPDGKLIASSSDDRTVRVWEALRTSYNTVFEGNPSLIRGLAFSPDGKLVASAPYNTAIRVWDAATGLCRSVLEGYTSALETVVFSSDGQHLCTDRGDVPLPHSSALLPSLQKERLFNVFIQNRWILVKQERVLWLPSKYRPSRTAVRKDVVCLGHSSGRITFIKVNTI